MATETQKFAEVERPRVPIRGAARQLGVHYTYLKRLADEHKIRFYRRGNKTQFYMDELREDLDLVERNASPDVREQPKRRRASRPGPLHPAAAAI